MNRFFTLLLAASCLTAVGQVGSQNCSGWGGPGISVTSEHGNSILVGEQVDFLMLDNNTPMMTCGSSFFTNPSSVTVISTSCVANQYISQSIVFNELGTFQILGQNGDGIGMTYCSLTITVADLEGCTSPDFLEFNPQATIDDGSCSTPVVFGCTDLEACNFDEAASVDDDSCTYSGCIDSSACNFQEDAACDDGSCDYSCCPGPGCCTEGMYWDWELSGCYNINPADINLDGCVQLNDLLDLLSAYGDCGAEESPWQCGDPLEYQGYDYETVQIGEQCWFAENLRAENYRDGTLIPSDLCGESWGQTTSGACDVYGEVCPTESCDASSPEFDACGGDGLSWGFGYLYNWYAISDSRGLCPEGWRVPLEEDLQSLELLLGLSNEEVVSVGWRGDGEGNSLKATFSWKSNGNGSDAIGWQGIAAGVKGLNGEFFGAGDFLNLWSSSSASVHNGWGRYLDHGSPDIYRNNYSKVSGMSVRCIKDAE